MRFEVTIYGGTSAKYGILLGRHWAWFRFDRIQPDRWNNFRTGFNLVLCGFSFTYYRNDL